ncbi:glycoside hydrolase family 65 protein [bacterium]
MENFFEQYLSKEDWLITENEWKSSMQEVRESQFTLGNGFICSRGVLEELPEKSCAGTFFAGLYDKTGAQVTELINAPNPINIGFMVEGEKLGIGTMDVLEHKRILDLKKGLLIRNSILQNAKKHRFDYQSARFFSMQNKHIAAMKIYITPLDNDAIFTVNSTIDMSVTNKGLITEGQKKHFHLYDFSKEDNVTYLCTKTLEKETLIAFASQLKIRIGKRSFFAPRRASFNLKVKKGQTICVTKYFSFYTSHQSKPRAIKTMCVSAVRKAVVKKFDKLVKEQTKAWFKKWKESDIKIYGNNKVAKAVRFNIYHLNIAAHQDNNDANVAAKTMSGEGYRGHIFWDTEIFILPFFIYTNPKIAKNLLLYRCKRLNAARANAKLNGYDGAMYPWESADTGEEATPSWYKTKDGDIMRVTTGFYEHHITADISYGILNYYNVTGDEQFLFKYGLEIIFEAAQFWASRVKYNSKRKKYEILGVTGPDEFHEHINNNAFTNQMAKWNLMIAIDLYKKFYTRNRREINNMLRRVNITVKELEECKKIGEKMYMPMLNKNIIEQYEGFKKLKKQEMPKRNHYLVPIDKTKFHEQDLTKTQFIKQADVLMLFSLFPEQYTDDLKKKNYDYYEQRTLHFSSLSAAVHAEVALDISKVDIAYKYFLTSLNADLENVYHNAGDGMHAASLGGTWKVLLHGFAGIRVFDGKIHCNPKIPVHWDGMKLSLMWKGYEVRFTIFKDKVTIHVYPIARRTRDLKINIFGKDHKIKINESMTFYN